MNKSLMITQDYSLVNAKYKLTPLEMKFILNAISHLDSKNDKILQEYEIKVSELEHKMRIGEGQHTRLKQFAKKLMSKPLVIDGKSGNFEVYNWFSRIRYVSGEAKFLVRFEEGLKPYLLELKERFVAYNLKNILPLTSNYSVRIYQLLKEYEKYKKRYFKVEELQDILQVPKSLKIYNRFKEKVLNVAYKELLEHTDIYFEFEEEKEGRKVVRLIFRIQKNTWKKEQEKPSLFDSEATTPSDYAKHLNKKIKMANGEIKTITEIVPIGGQIKLTYNDDKEDFSLIDLDKFKKMV